MPFGSFHYRLKKYGLAIVLFLTYFILIMPLPLVAQSSDLVLFDYKKTNSSNLEGSVSEVITKTLPFSAMSVAEATSTVIADKGNSDNRIDLVFVSDGYTSEQQQAFNAKVDQIVSIIFTQEPLAAYRDYFNVHRVNVSSKDSGAINYPLKGDQRDTALGSYLYCQEVPETLCTNVSKAWQYASVSRAADQVIVLVNVGVDASSAYPFSSLSVLSAGHSDASNSLLHQLGHSFANLADEYSSGSWPQFTGFEPFEVNISTQKSNLMLEQKLKWHAWLGEESNLGVIGTYQGALGHESGIYRSSLNSKMRDLSADFNGPSKEAFIKEIYKKVHIIEHSTPINADLSGSDTISVSHLKADHDKFNIKWFVNGVRIEGANNSSFRPNDYRLSNGLKEVKVHITDETPLVKDETFRMQHMHEERKWNVNVMQIPPVILTHPKNSSLYVGEVVEFSVVAEGEDLSFQWYKNDILIEGASKAKFTTEKITKLDNDTSYSVKVSNIAGSIISNPAIIQVKNRAPLISQINNLEMLRTDDRSISLVISDPDNDHLTLQANLIDPDSVSGIEINVLDESTLKITTSDEYVGVFGVLVKVSDGIDFVEEQFQVTVRNALPVIASIDSVYRKPKAGSFTVPFSVLDPDNDPVSTSVRTFISNASASVSILSSSILISPADNYSGSFSVHLTASDGFGSSQRSFRVYVENAPPSIANIPLLKMHWRESEKSFNIPASDPDGDKLSYAFELQGSVANVTLSSSGSNLIVKPGLNYLGTFHVKAIVTDGVVTVEKIFSVQVENRAPVVQVISPITAHWKTNSLNVVIPAIDNDTLDGEHLSCNAQIVTGTPPVTLEVNNCLLKMNFVDSFKGSFEVRVSATDGQASSAPRNFTVTMNNNQPVINPIPDQHFSRQETPHLVEVSSHDPDGDELSIIAVLADNNLDAGVGISVQGNKIILSPDNSYQGSARIKVTASDGDLSASTEFNFISNNRPPVLTPIDDLNLHWFNDAIHTLQLRADDPNDPLENLNFTVTVLDTKMPEGTVTVVGNVASIKLPDKYLGSFPVKVEVSDGEFKDSGTFMVFSNNSPPELSPICDHSFTFAEAPYSLKLDAHDEDDEDLEYSFTYTYYTLPFELDARHNFHRASGGWYFNTLGHSEKFLKGKALGSDDIRWFIILPDGNLYQYEGSLSSSIHVAKLPEAYYLDPELLIDVSANLNTDLISIDLQGENLVFYPEENFKGSIIVHARAQDKQLFDEESFLVTVHSESLYIDAPSEIALHWRDQGLIPLSSFGYDSSLVNISASFTDTTVPYNLYQEHVFGDYLSRETYQTNNVRGKGEKYFIGSKGSSNHFLYAILPTGDVYACSGSILSGSIDNSVHIGTVPISFYHKTDLFYDVPPPGASPLNLEVTENGIKIIPEAGFKGKVLLTVKGSANGSSDTRDVLVNVYNSLPQLNTIDNMPFVYDAEFTMGWKDGILSLPITFSDIDDLDLAHLQVIVSEQDQIDYSRSILENYELGVEEISHKFNETGWREKYFTGKLNGVVRDFALLPSGGLYIWNGSVKSSTLLGRFPSEFYSKATILEEIKSSPVQYSPFGAGISSDGKKLHVQPPQNFTGQLKIYVRLTDGDAEVGKELTVKVVNSSPAFVNMLPLSMHMRGGPVSRVLEANDPDNDPLNYFLNTVSSNNNLLPVSSSLDGAIATFHSSPFFKGSFQAIATVSDGNNTIQSSFPVDVVNTPPAIAPLQNRVVGWQESEVKVNINFVDADSQDANNLNVRAFIGSIEQVALKLSKEYKFKTALNGRVNNQAGYFEKYFTGEYNSEIVEFVILPGGGIYRWHQSAPIVPAIGFLPLAYYNNPELLYSSGAVDQTPNVQLSINGNVLSVHNTQQNYKGSFPVTVLVNDGYDFDYKTFTITYQNSPPLVQQISNRSYHWRGTIPALSINANDPNGDVLHYAAQQLSGPQFVMSLQNNLLSLQSPENYVGQASFRVSASDPEFTIQRDFSVSLTNSPPVIQTLGSVNASWTETITKHIPVSDPDGDPLTLRAYPNSLSANLVTATMQGHQLTVTPITPFNGTAQVIVEASDGPSKAQRVFTVYYANKPPTISQIQSTSVHWRESNLLVPISVHDVDGDEVSLNAKQSTGEIISMNINISNSLLEIEFLEELDTSSFGIMIEASDGDKTSSRGFIVTITNNAPVLENIAPGLIDDRNEVHSIQLQANDKDKDPLEYSLQHVPAHEVGNHYISKHRFLKKSADHDFNRLLNNEKYVMGYRPGSSVLRTYVIFPDGRMFEWNGQLTNSVFIDYLPIEYYVDPSRLFSVSPHSDLPDFGNYDVEGSTVKIEPFADFSGELWFKASVTDTKDSDQKYFRIVVDRDDGDNSDEHDDDNIDDDYDEEETDSPTRKMSICHFPPEDPSNARTVRINASTLLAHLAHGDFIGECPGAPNDPGDGGRTCDEKQLFSSPNYTLWNSFLGMINILELTNPSNNDILVDVSFYSISGDLTHKVKINVPAVNQFDVIINDFPGFRTDSYGVIKLEFEGPLDGRMMYYRSNSSGNGFDFAYGLPLEDAQFGTTAVGFNTFQPSMKPQERNNIVTNWLSIVNLANSAKRYTVLSYDIAGHLIMRREVNVLPFGRADIDGGHSLAGPDTVGYHKVIPSDITAEYIALVTRFGGDAPLGFAPSEFKFAFPLSARLGQSDPIFLSISRKFNETNWIEVVNILDSSVMATINYYVADGRILESVDAMIPANAQMHFNASERLPENGTGFAMIIPRVQRSIIAQSMGYLREVSSGSVTSVYGAQARRAVPCVQSGSYNLFLGMENWLLLGNPTNETVETLLKLTGPGMDQEKTILLPPKSSQFLPIHDGTQYGTSTDTYGLLAIYPKDPSVRLFAQVLRLRFRADNSTDFSAPLPVR